jgi:TonB family protein
MKYPILLIIISTLAIANNYSHSNNYYKNYLDIFSGKDIGQYFQYPEQSISHSISGTSIIEFNVNKDGSLNDINIINSLGPQFDRVILDGLGKFSIERLKSLNIEYGFRYRLPLRFEN